MQPFLYVFQIFTLLSRHPKLHQYFLPRACRQYHVHIYLMTLGMYCMLSDTEAFCGGQCGQCLTTVCFGCLTSSTYTSLLYLFAIIILTLIYLLIYYLFIDLLSIYLLVPTFMNIALCSIKKKHTQVVRESLTCVLYARFPATFCLLKRRTLYNEERRNGGKK